MKSEAFGIGMEEAKISDPRERSSQNMLEQQPEEISAQ
jgi:hypothetical protein